MKATPTCADCRTRGSVWLDDDNLTAGRCPNQIHPWNKADSPALVQLAAAHPKAMAAAKAIILDWLASNDTVTPDDVIPWMNVAQIPQQIRGLAFAALSTAKVIERVELVASGNAKAHGKPVGVWRRAAA